MFWTGSSNDPLLSRGPRFFRWTAHSIACWFVRKRTQFCEHIVVAIHFAKSKPVFQLLFRVCREITGSDLGCHANTQVYPEGHEATRSMVIEDSQFRNGTSYVVSYEPTACGRLEKMPTNDSAVRTSGIDNFLSSFKLKKYLPQAT